MNVANLTGAELRKRANDCMEGFQAAISPEKQDLLAEAQFYLAEIERRDQVAERRHTRWIELRDLVLELVIIGLISWELWFAHTEGKAQLEVLHNLQLSSSSTANTLRGVQKAQEETAKEIQPQAALLQRTLKTLSTQLNVTKGQQALISRQLAIQESAVAERQRAPIIEVRAYNKTPKKVGGEYKLIQPGTSSSLGYPARRLDDGRSQEIRINFLIRDIGTAPILNLSPHVRAPAAYKVKCLDFNGLLRLYGESPEECSAPLDKIPPIDPIPKETPVGTPQAPSDADFVIGVILVGPIDVPQFDISLELFADNLHPIYYRMQLTPWLKVSPYAE